MGKREEGERGEERKEGRGESIEKGERRAKGTVNTVVTEGGGI